ncbi:MAG: dynamin, partial [Actinomycetota bacterium]
DGIGDLSSDVDHDLHARIRDLLRESDDAIDEGDPAEVWPEFEEWLYRRVTEEVTRNYTLMHLKANELGKIVTEHFDLGRDDLGLVLETGAPDEALDAVKASAAADLERMNVTSQALSVLRGGYMGTMMFGMIAQGLSLAMFSPATVAIGLVMGKRGLGEEKKRQLAMRRGQAKNAVRKYVEEARFLVAKDSRDTIRKINRQLRDHFAGLAEELHRSTNEAVLSAQHAASMGQEERAKHLRNVEAELRRIIDLRQRVTAAFPESASP